MANKYPEHEFSNARVPSDENGVPYPAHIVAEDLSDAPPREHSPRGDGALDDPEDFPNCYDTYRDSMDGVSPQSVDEEVEDDNDSHLADDSKLDEEDEAHGPDGDQYIDGYDRTLLALQRAGVPFSKTNWIAISADGTLELCITQAH